MGQLDGKIAIITGAGSGIGRAAAILFAQHGARLILGDKSAAVHDTAHQIGDAAIAVEMDAGLETDVAALVALAVATHGRLDIAFANAGISGGMDGIFDATPELFAEVLRVNLIGPWLMVKHAGKAMQMQTPTPGVDGTASADGAASAATSGGSIICTASVAGIRSGAGGPPYSASKAGVINLVQVSAQQLTGTGIRVNAICPGLTETGMTKPTFDYARDKGVTHKLGQLNPLKRGAQPEELANAALFLASDQSSYVNGHALVVDGGLASSHPVTRQLTGQTAV